MRGGFSQNKSWKGQGGESGGSKLCLIESSGRRDVLKNVFRKNILFNLPTTTTTDKQSIRQ